MKKIYNKPNYKVRKIEQEVILAGSDIHTGKPTDGPTGGDAKGASFRGWGIDE